MALAVKGVTTGMSPGTTAVAAAPGMVVAAALTPCKMNSIAGAECRCLFHGVIFQEKRKGRGGDAAAAPVAAAPNPMTNSGARANDGSAGARARGVDVVNITESFNRRLAAADAAIDRRQDNGDAIIATFTTPSSSCETTTRVF